MNAFANQDSTTEKVLDALVEGRMEGSPPLAGLQVVVLQGGAIIYEYAGGFARRSADSPTALNLDHKVRVASISKLVAAVGLMQLVQQGRIDLGVDVSVHLGFPLRNPDFPDQPITARMLLSHTSSIRDGSQYWLESGGRFEDFFLPGREHFDDGAHFAGGEGRQPGRYFTYSNLNFGVVAALIERISGQRFDRYMKTNVLQPLGLEASYNVCDLSWKQPEQLAALWRKRDDEEVWQPEAGWVAQLDDEAITCHYGAESIGRGEDPGEILPGYEMGQNPTLFSPQGGLRASARDLAVIAQMLMNGGEYNGKRVLDDATVRDMFATIWRYDPAQDNGDTREISDPDDPTPDRLFLAYGLSVHQVDLKDWDLADKPRALYGHLGEAYGLLGLFWMEPESGNALIALITGLGDDPGKHPGVSPLYRPEEEIMRWWLNEFGK